MLVSFEAGRSVDESELPHPLFVSAITLGELRSGVLNAPNPPVTDLPLRTFTAAAQLGRLPVADAVVASWARLRAALQIAGLKTGLNASWIAAAAMAHNLPVATQDDGFPELDELSVMPV
ncbi:MAG: PIN domain-containing protein [Microthrixaceae bacterium]